MNAMSFNCRGLGNPVTVRELRKIVKQEGPALLFVMETKIKGNRVEALRTTLGFAGCFVVDSDGLSGGIGMFWSHYVVVDLKNYSRAHIDVKVRWKDHDLPPWRFTGFYGEPRAENTYQSWNFFGHYMVSDMTAGYVWEILMRLCMPRNTSVFMRVLRAKCVLFVRPLISAPSKILGGEESHLHGIIKSREQQM